MNKTIKITQVRSIIDRSVDQKKTIKALGLGKINKTVIKKDTPQIRGMIEKVKHLVKFEVINNK
ncbi:MAG: 50S ribosomal protein L30 [Ignavibacteria bacterium]